MRAQTDDLVHREQIPGQSVRELKGTEAETKSHELLSFAPVGTLKLAPCPCDVTLSRHIFTRFPFFNTFKSGYELWLWSSNF